MSIGRVAFFPRRRAVGKGISLGQAATAVKGEGCVELPEAERCLVRGSEQTFVAVGQRLTQELAAVGRLHIVVAIGCRHGHAPEEVIGGVDLEGVGVGLTMQVADMDLRWISVIIDDGLIAEASIVVLSIKLQCLTAEWDVQRRAESIVPRILLVELVDDELTSAGHEIVVLGQGVHRAIALTGRGAQAPQVVDLPLHMKAGRDEGAVFRAVVDADARHGHETLVEVVGVLGIAAYHIFLLVEPLAEVGLTHIVVVQRGTDCEVVLRSEVGLEHQLRVDVFLVDVVSLATVGGIHLVHRGG